MKLTRVFVTARKRERNNNKYYVVHAPIIFSKVGFCFQKMFRAPMPIIDDYTRPLYPDFSSPEHVFDSNT